MSLSQVEAPPTPMPPVAATSQRLMSLDALRGFDMFWIIGAESLVYALHRMVEAGGHAVSKPSEISSILTDAKKDGRKAVLLRVKGRDGTRFVAVATNPAS